MLAVENGLVKSRSVGHRLQHARVARTPDSPGLGLLGVTQSRPTPDRRRSPELTARTARDLDTNTANQLDETAARLAIPQQELLGVPAAEPKVLAVAPETVGLDERERDRWELSRPLNQTRLHLIDLGQHLRVFLGRVVQVNRRTKHIRVACGDLRRGGRTAVTRAIPTRYPVRPPLRRRHMCDSSSTGCWGRTNRFGTATSDESRCRASIPATAATSMTHRAQFFPPPSSM